MAVLWANGGTLNATPALVALTTGGATYRIPVDPHRTFLLYNPGRQIGGSSSTSSIFIAYDDPADLAAFVLSAVNAADGNEAMIPAGTGILIGPGHSSIFARAFASNANRMLAILPQEVAYGRF